MATAGGAHASDLGQSANREGLQADFAVVSMEGSQQIPTYERQARLGLPHPDATSY